MAMNNGSPGRIITFYSYKGGTGRTMALANTAWVLASNGYRVLMIDWDLEAPGLHRYFHPFLSDKRLARTKGMIDLVFEYQRSVLALPEIQGTHRFPPEWYDRQLDIFAYITELVWQQPGFGELHLLPAGRQGAEYGTLVNTFNWRQLYENLGGFEFFEAMKRQLVREYDYVLVDSRTGVSDTSGISTVQMPDTLVVCFTLNSQSIEGAGEVALSVTEQRVKEYADGTFRVLPVPTRLEKAEKQKLDLARDAARTKFDTFLTRLTPADRDTYWGEVEIFYEPFYAYEEVLATFADKPGPISSLLASIQRLTYRLTDGKISRMGPLEPAKREEILAAYERRSEFTSDSGTLAAAALKRLGPQLENVARNILLRSVSAGVGGTAFRTAVATNDFSDEERPVVNRLVDEKVLDRTLAEDKETEYITIKHEDLISTWPTLRGWIRENERTMLVRESIEQRAQNWDRKGRPSGLLLSFQEVAQLTSGTASAELLSARARLFLDASTRQATRRKWFTIGAEAVAALVVLGFLIQGYFAPRIRSFLILNRVQTKIAPYDRQKYVLIPAGSFQMGCGDDISGTFGFYCSDPSYQVILSAPFWMGQTEVTNAAFRRYLTASHPDQLGAFDDKKLPSDYPVNNLSWPDAYEFCAWAGGRLPSLAEWEYAARAGIPGKPYITGDTLDRTKVAVGNNLFRVAMFLPNPYGLFDMTGNVAEWSGDISPSYSSGFSSSSSRSVRDPHYTPANRVVNDLVTAQRSRYAGGGVITMAVRGGSYDSGLRDLRLDSILYRNFNEANPSLGFRCVMDPTDLEKVASNYQPFSALYASYSYFYHARPSYFDPYLSWWYTIYLRYLENGSRR
jgi:formylglycine-generating enzyme required for sulfatase activity/cellulose biosynthesis protein BcsQ